ncbi:hypothetical protein, partial [Pseudoflavonifractor phocaeensis]|uniref:hypothetical protein n=1 Tax=Pseudoflavonifractor phocaeensis TaxID=1870988 RepID=UPI001956D3C1
TIMPMSIMAARARLRTRLRFLIWYSSLIFLDFRQGNMLWPSPQTFLPQGIEEGTMATGSRQVAKIPRKIRQFPP